MKKTTQLNLSKRVAQYGALTVAMAGMTDVNGQISYTDQDPDFNGSPGNDFFLDLNNDADDDFRIYNGSASSLNLYIAPLTASNDVLGSGGGNFAYPFALSSGAMISSGASNWFNNGYSSGYQSLNYGSCSFGNWCSVTDRYIGLRFDIGGNIHYGWVRLDVDADGLNWVVKDFAYNTVAGQSIVAGQQTLGIEDNQLSDVNISALNKTVVFGNVNTPSEYSIISMAGAVVIKGNISDHTTVVEAGSLSSGVYIVELSNDKGIMRKKIIL